MRGEAAHAPAGGRTPIVALVESWAREASADGTEYPALPAPADMDDAAEDEDGA